MMDHRLNKLLDYGERLFLVVLSSFFLRSILLGAVAHPVLILIAISECLPVVLILIRRPGAISTSPSAFLTALVGTATPLMLRPHVAPLLPMALLALLMLLGLFVNVSAKIALWRSFGLAAANRGVRAGGPYRLVRHPMYLGYFITEVGFLLGNPSPSNIAICAVTWSAQLLRIGEEERFLLTDQSYRDLVQRVRFRLLPGLY
jgi:protein-S-isoprenylcysteine O-methyltransferase Ste14